MFTRNKAAGRECNWFARNGRWRGEGYSALGEFSLSLSLSRLGKRVESPFSFRGLVCVVGVVWLWSSSGGMQMDDFVRESRVSRSCTRPSENNKSRLTTPVRSFRFFYSFFFPFFLQSFPFSLSPFAFVSLNVYRQQRQRFKVASRIFDFHPVYSRTRFN